jgi:hypothetical protein
MKETELLNLHKVDLRNKVHFPSDDKWNNLEKIVISQILKIDQLDIYHFYKDSLITESIMKQNTLQLIEKDEQDKL